MLHSFRLYDVLECLKNWVINMKFLFKILLVFISILGFFVGYHFKLSRFHNIEFNLSSEDFAKACRQERTGRIWKEVRLDTVFSIRNYNSNPIFYPLKVYVDSHGDIYVLDVYTPAVLKFSSRGSFIHKFGKGKGEGPGEFEQPTDFSISPDGYLYVSDLSTHLVSVFDSVGKLIQAIRIDGAPGRIVGLFDKKFIVQRFGIGDMFQKYDIAGNLLISFGKFFKEQNSYAIPIDLKMFFDGRNVYCAFIRGGYLLSYDVDGQLNYLCETIDKFPFPEVKVSQGREKDAKVIRVMLDPDAPVSALDLSVSDSLIYILAGTASKKEGAVVIDVYNKFNGKYLFSFKFSKLTDTEGIQSCVISGGNLYTCEILKGGTTCVRKYRFRIF